MEKVSEVLQKRKDKLNELKKTINIYPNSFRVEHDVADILKAAEGMNIQPEEINDDGPVFTAAGRMMAVNRFGKSAFVRFRDRTGQMQAYVRQDIVGAEAYAIFKQMDVGDFVGLTGTLFKTKSDELTLLVKSIELVGKSAKPLPEKFHGLKDPEKRYRQRYLDLIMNPESREVFIKRSKIIQEIREFFLERDFMEVETPMMQPIAGGAEALPFKTHHNALDMDLFLRIAPELYLKRLVVGGFERVFEINRSFRNEGVSTRHNPEFTMIEFYWAYANYHDLMDLTEELYARLAEKVCGSSTITYQGTEINLKGPWRRLKMLDALVEMGGVPQEILNDKDALLKWAAENNVEITKTGKLGKVITKLFEELVEPKLIQPTFVTDYPKEVSPLARGNDNDPEFTERFEMFIYGREMSNGFSELNDPEDQRERFLDQVQKREAGDEEAHQMDEDYVEALEYGLPPTAGEGIGIDRLVMLLTDSPSIREVILFPHMKLK